jgi:hypothetical protein
LLSADIEKRRELGYKDILFYKALVSLVLESGDIENKEFEWGEIRGENKGVGDRGFNFLDFDFTGWLATVKFKFR